ncbi:MAG: hypothetical protein H6891_03355 [Brucellaceae bacterium]|nr:hypothetical protein [Brucellaceae bacterium]
MATNGIDRILVLDGEILIAMEVAQILEDGFACAAVAASWSTFDDRCPDDGFDLIVMDCEYVPVEIVEALARAPFDRVPLVFLTTGSQPCGGASAAAIPLVEKPILPDALLAAVRRVLLSHAA